MKIQCYILINFLKKVVIKLFNQKDIIINPDGLNETINILKKDNEEINNILTNIWNILSSLDESVWNSPEKNKLNEKFIPYIDRKRTSFPIYFNNLIYELQRSLTSYVETNNINLKDTSNLVGKIIGGK